MLFNYDRALAFDAFSIIRPRYRLDTLWKSLARSNHIQIEMRRVNAIHNTCYKCSEGPRCWILINGSGWDETVKRLGTRHNWIFFPWHINKLFWSEVADLVLTRSRRQLLLSLTAVFASLYGAYLGNILKSGSKKKPNRFHNYARWNK